MPAVALRAPRAHHPLSRRTCVRRTQLPPPPATAAGRGFAGPRDPYTVLGVPRGASPAEIKRAYKKKALALHPDVNKAPDATAQFMECKAAFQALTGGGGGGAPGAGGGASAGGWGGRASSSSSSSRPRPSARPPETFYGLGDFFRDLEADLAASAAKRRAEEAAAGGSGGAGASSYSSSSSSTRSTPGPRSLWEELAALGSEFVEFLEAEAGLPKGVGGRRDSAAYAAAAQAAAERMAASAAADARAAAAGAARAAKDAADAARARVAADDGKRAAAAAEGAAAAAAAAAGAAAGGRAAASSAAAAAKSAADEDVEEALRALKKKLGKL